MTGWAIITGGGTGIGAALAKHFATMLNLKVLIVGRRLQPLQEVKQLQKDSIFVVHGDITQDDTLNLIVNTIPEEEQVKYLIQNAAVGEPAKLGSISKEHFDYAFSVNVTAPLMLTQKLLPRLQECDGRILHLGTGVAFNAQLGTATYGVTKMAFHRLYEQLRVDLASTGVCVGSASPGVVDTEGVWEHYKLAKDENLPHTAYFDHVKQEGQVWSPAESAQFLSFVLMETDDQEFTSAEWRMNDESHWGRWKKDIISSN